MSRKVVTDLSSWMILIRPPRSTTNRRLSRALVRNTGFEKPALTTVVEKVAAAAGCAASGERHSASVAQTRIRRRIESSYCDVTAAVTVLLSSYDSVTRFAESISAPIVHEPVFPNVNFTDRNFSAPEATPDTGFGASLMTSPGHEPKMS